MNRYVLLEWYSGGWWWQDVGTGYMAVDGRIEPKVKYTGAILREAEAEDFEDLDWTGTYLDRPDLDTGWLDREGRHYGCRPEDHDKYAQRILRVEVKELEQAGWARLSGYYVQCLKRFSAEQRNWMRQHGIDPDEWEL